MQQTPANYADYLEYDRRQRGIERHVLTAFLGGLAVGGLVTALPGPLSAVYDPYAVLGLAVAVGATASGIPWALLTAFLAGASSIVTSMAVGAIQGHPGFELVGDDARGLNLLLLQLVIVGLLANLARRAGAWGDAAAGLVGAVLLGDVIDRATPGLVAYERGFWPWPALVVGVLTAAGVILLRRRHGMGVLRALAVTAALAGSFALLVLLVLR
ncbi:hypothetical protein [Thermoactinospora rubra]|uniref:hypothetical protein n=1 Tax=Thermoactinospora rubra TaxID=1088767 RepID=UPI000A1093C2|nr:hypothetical protein [Thermoactinospora rubra]